MDYGPEDKQPSVPGGKAPGSKPPGNKAAEQGQSSSPRQKEEPKENIKETIESILVAFILAFVFRAFVVEAFVIPTGSMAPTLLGAHMRYRCEDCGYQFTVNYPTPPSRDDNLNIDSVAGPKYVGGRRADAVFSVHCPNCGMKVPDRKYQAVNPPVYFGDRILVLKYLYLLQDPSRWDVVVFKSPTEQERYDFSQNFIKRLVGKPGETVMLLDGDVYVCPNEKAGGTLESRPWQVQTKPRKAQEALWRIVYDNDFHPVNSTDRVERSGKWVMPWQARSGSGWNTGGRTIEFDNAQGAGSLYFNKDANRGTLPLTDWLAYDETKWQPSVGGDYAYEAYENEKIPHWYVSDLKVQFYYERRQGDGPLRVSLTKLGEKFTAELYPDKARLLHRLPSGQVKQVGQDVALSGGRLKSVEFTNIDYRVTLRVDGKNLIQSTPQEYSPNIADLLARYKQRSNLAAQGASPEQIRNVFPPPDIELAGERQAASISHLSLWRDVYYTPGYNRYGDDLARGNPDRPVTLHRRGDVDADGNKLDNEYFVLGDNSILSADGRQWTEPVDLKVNEDLVAEAGRVPERFLLGKAFFVYWPAGYRPFSVEAPGVVPDFGDMRFIH